MAANLKIVQGSVLLSNLLSETSVLQNASTAHADSINIHLVPCQMLQNAYLERNFAVKFTPFAKGSHLKTDVPLVASWPPSSRVPCNGRR